MVSGLDPTFCWPIFLNDEIFCCSVLKFPQSVLWKSSYCQKWYLGILLEDSTKAGHRIKTKQVLPLLLFGTWRILWLVFSGFSFILHSAKRSAARLTPNLYQWHTHTPIEETGVLLTAGSDRTGEEKNKLLIAFPKAGIIQAAPRALTALNLHLSYI